MGSYSGHAANCPDSVNRAIERDDLLGPQDQIVVDDADRAPIRAPT